MLELCLDLIIKIMLGLAIAITAEAFKEKKDKGGNPYILHCLRVMDGVWHLGHDAMCAAVMHDLVEDADYTNRDLLELGFSDEIVMWVDLLTHNPDREYMSYINRLSFDKVAKEIKKADLRDNSDITRLKGLRKKDFDRLEKYSRAYVYLSE